MRPAWNTRRASFEELAATLREGGIGYVGHGGGYYISIAWASCNWMMTWGISMTNVDPNKEFFESQLQSRSVLWSGRVSQRDGFSATK
jgi:hypothetical protein